MKGQTTTLKGIHFILILFLFCIVISFEVKASDGRESVYLDPSATAAGTGTETEPYQDIEDAIARAEELTSDGKSVTIWIMDEIVFTSDKAWDFDNQDIEFKRYENYDGVLFQIDSGITLTLKNTVVDGNKDEISAERTMFFINGTFIADNVVFRNNTNAPSDKNEDHGGALHLAASGISEISDSTFCNNTSAYGGAIYSQDNVTITGTTFSGNTATSYGGAIYTSSSRSDSYVNVTIDSCTMSDNTAAYGGALAIMNGPDFFQMENTDLTGNTATSGGGAIYSHSPGMIKLLRGTISGNTSSGYSGGTISIIQMLGKTPATTALTMDGVTISDNSTSSGGALYAANTGDIKITSCTLANNSASSDSPYASNNHGGAIYYSTDVGSSSEYGQITITDSKITENTAGNYGGGIYSPS